VLYFRKGPRSRVNSRKGGNNRKKDVGKEANERFLLVTCNRPVRDRSMSGIQSGTIVSDQ
jgi:hypothetical protein